MIAKANLAKLTSGLDQQVYQIVVHQSLQQRRSSSLQDIQAALPDHRLRSTDLSRLLASLEQRGYIVSQVAGGRRLYSMREMSGAGTAPPWAADGNFNRQLAGLWMDAAREIVTRESTEVRDFVGLERISAALRARFTGSTSDTVKLVLTALCLDGRLMASSRGDSTVYAPVPGYDVQTRRGDAFQAIPCTCCPLLESCGAGSPINAATCEYMRLWADKRRVGSIGHTPGHPVELEDIGASGSENIAVRAPVR